MRIPSIPSSVFRFLVPSADLLRGVCLLSGVYLIALCTSPGAVAQDPLPPKDKRIVFLGDSITHAGGYIAILEAALRVEYPDRQPPEFINLGLPSETVSGLSEPGHAGGSFPRPNLHERLGRILQETKPNLVIACYGMNCGMYYPLSDDRFAKFQSGIELLHNNVVESGARIIHLTPAYFDALPIRDRLLPDGLDEYRQPYAKYDDALEAYSQWLLKQRDRGWTVLDVHGAMKNAVAKARESDPNFTLASDGVHPNAAGQAIVAGPLAAHWGLSLNPDGLPKHPRAAELVELIASEQNKLKLAWLSITKHVRPGIPEGMKLDQVAKENLLTEQKIKAILQP